MYSTPTKIIQALDFSGERQLHLFKDALEVTEDAFGNEVLIRGVIEITNLCKVNCDYCSMRRDNTHNNSIYLMKSNEIAQASRLIKENDVNVVVLQGGEIPQTTKLVGQAIPKIRSYFNDNVEIILQLGQKSREEYEYFYDQGATSYIITHETSDVALHERIRHENYRDRINAITSLLDIGFKVGTGIIVGLPNQTYASIADDILMMGELGVHMASITPLIPAPDTPFRDLSYGSINLTLNSIAILRILNPNLLIPAGSALETVAPGGQRMGLNAGANVLTINFTPTLLQNRYLVYGGNRHIVKQSFINKLLIEAKKIRKVAMLT